MKKKQRQRAWFMGGACAALLIGGAIPVQANLIAYYPLSADLADNAGANDGTFEGTGGTNAAATFVGDATFGSVLDFDGVDDRISLGPVLDLQNSSWSISLWVRTPATANRVPLLGKNNGDNGFSAGERVFEITGNGTWGNIINPEPAGNLAVNGHSQGGVVSNQAAIAIDDGTWHMVTMVHDDTISATHHDLYIDGVLQTPGGQTMNNNARANVGGFYLGFANASGSGAGGYLTGQMAEVNIFNSAIDQAQVDALFSVTVGDDDPNLVAPATVIFDPTSVPAGEVSRSFKIRNSGASETLFVSAVRVSSEASSWLRGVSPPTQPIPPGQSADIGLAIEPDALGTFSATVTILSDDPSSPAVTEVTFDVLPDPFMEATSPTVLDRVAANEGTVTRSVEVSNSGLTQDLLITAAAFAGPDAGHFSNPVLPATMAPGVGAAISFDFDASAGAGTYSATLEVTSNSQDAPVIPINLEISVDAASDGSLVAYWPFDSDASDVLGNHHGTLQNNASITAGSLGFGGGEALSLNGGTGAAADHVTTASPQSFDFNNDFTWHAYVKTSTVNGGVFGRTPAAGTTWNQGSKGLFLEGGRVEFDTGWVGNPNTGVTINDDQWHQLIVSFEAATDALKIWIDPSAGDAPDLSLIHDVNRWDEHTHSHNGGIAHTSFRIGQTSDNFQANAIVGLIDEAAVFDQALNGLQLDQLINEGPGSFATVEPFAIQQFSFDPDTNEVTLTWDSNVGETFAVVYSTDMVDWGADLDDTVEADAGDSTSRTYNVANEAAGGRLYIRIERR